MRIINADALKSNMFNYAPPEMTWDRGDIEHKIDEQPTIAAIPVEWLKGLMLSTEDDVDKVEFEWIMREWQEEQEAQDAKA